jgi:hypothetical protein
VHFLKGVIEQIPRPAASVDVVISNCVINLSETLRRFRPDGSRHPPAAGYGVWSGPRSWRSVSPAVRRGRSPANELRSLARSGIRARVH